MVQKYIVKGDNQIHKVKVDSLFFKKRNIKAEMKEI